MSIISSKSLVKEALKHVKIINFKKALMLHKNEKVIFIDLRDIRELEKTGKISNAKHVPRGMLEFWIDPKSPYYKEFFKLNYTYIFYCASGWRSALAAKTAIEMGLSKVYHLDKGIAEWIKLNGPIERSIRKTNKI